MVSLRRRRLLGLCCGPNGYVTPLPFLTAEEYITGVRNPDAEVYKNRGPIEGTIQPREEPEEKSTVEEVLYLPSQITPAKVKPVSPGDSGSLSMFAVADPPIKRRKRHRRKQVQNQEPCLMRGVYYKNMKWQAAIKVDKKQIHLGTFSSQEEAARLYDRAAFMCGREPNFELSEEEKRELQMQSWEEFLANTRRTITNKKPKRRVEPSPVKTSRPATALGELAVDEKSNPNDVSCSDGIENGSFSS
ncbi:PREDICTED: ethylene-responsive transcription factor-like protein At4g13040 [Tarenaya hassleriana]|uniref:ethylene-responsive transcription factor-like protein At4g13040 n=1 Tax=Tarenaya hassleriana TaxID=28532 RepID=UPI00053C2FC4|nr:PREDICTED: ethylene-responsive transcription factor-like protein At4g13040 [Tarenaya hassleriana]XP_010527256.1 PREDICTED: ethylene-responsive transcription factor-like protein At4g13040 [Tarenaya hassleriana]